MPRFGEDDAARRDEPGACTRCLCRLDCPGDLLQRRHARGLGQRYLVAMVPMALDQPDLGRYPSILTEDTLPKEPAEARDRLIELKAYRLSDPAPEGHKADFLTWLFGKAGMSGDEVAAAFRRGAARHRVKYSRLKHSAHQRRRRQVREMVGGGRATGGVVTP